MHYLFEFLLRTEDYIEFIRGFHLSEILDFANKVHSFIRSTFKFNAFYGWPSYNYFHDLYPIAIDFPLNYISFYKSFPQYSSVHYLLSNKSKVFIFFEKNHIYKTQFFIIAESLKILNLITEFLNAWKVDFIPKSNNYEHELKKIKDKNPEKLEEFLELLDNLSFVMESDYKNLSKEYIKLSDNFKKYFNQLHKYFNFTQNSGSVFFYSHFSEYLKSLL